MPNRKNIFVIRAISGQEGAGRCLGHSVFVLRDSDLPRSFLSPRGADLSAAGLELAAFLGAGFLRLRRRRFLGGDSFSADFASISAFLASLVSSLLAFDLAAAFFLGGAKPKNSPG